MAVIELQEDDPNAVDSMLRYIYSFPYPRSVTNGPNFHMNVFITAKKYLLTELESIALVGVTNSINSIEAEYRNHRDITGIFELFKLLSAHKSHHDDFESMIAQLTRRHLGLLFAIAEFRQMLEEDENKETLGVVVKAVQDSHERSPAIDSGEGNRQFATCPTCSAMWATAGPLGFRCPRCNILITTAQNVSRWRRT